jgi:hypothetical protein
MAPRNKKNAAIQAELSAARVRTKLHSHALTSEELEQLIQRVVHATLANIGIIADTPEEAAKLRQDFAYTRAWRETIQKGTRTGWLTFVTVAVTGFLGTLVVGIRYYFTGHP